MGTLEAFDDALSEARAAAGDSGLRRAAVGVAEDAVSEGISRDSDAARFFRHELPAVLSSPVPALSDGVVVRFDIRGPGGGVFDLVSTEGAVIAAAGPTGPRDCTVVCAVADWESCIGGRIAALRAFADGRLRISGDVGLLLRIQDALGERAA